MAGQLKERRLESLGWRELGHAWREFAAVAVGRIDPATGLLPPALQKTYLRYVAEYRRRGEQLRLF